MVVVFWLLVLACSYSYFIYPLILLGLCKERRSDRDAGEEDQRVTIIIAARNEQERIRGKVEDVLKQDYPGKLLEIIVVSDASTDGTDRIVASWSEDNVRLLRKDVREGKESAQAFAISEAAGDVLVFTDAATRMAPGSLRALVDALQRDDVGAVSSVDRFEGNSRGGEGLYVKYEMALRTLESRCAGLVGLSGSFFGVRKEVAQRWRVDVPSDFVVAMASVQMGLKAISEDSVVGIYSDLKRDGDEFARKRRTAIRGMTALGKMAEMLNPFKYGAFAFQIFSHKVMRWAVPWFAVVLLFVSVGLADVYGSAQLLLVLQLAFYFLALLGWRVPRLRKFTLFRTPWYFVQVNVALAMAAVDFIRGRRVIVWEPSAR